MDTQAEKISTTRNDRDLTTALAFMMLIALAGSYVVNAMDRQVFPVLLVSINKTFHFSLAQGGFLSTIFTLGIGLGGIPTGYVLDRFSRKTTVLVGILVYSIFTLLTAFAISFVDMAFYRAMTGVGEAMQNAALFSAVGAYFYRRRALALGSLNFAYGLGGFFGPLLGTQMLTTFGTWKVPFYMYGIVGCAFVVLIFLAVPKIFTERVDIMHENSTNEQVVHMPVQLFNRNIIVGIIAAAVVGLSMYSYIGLYPTFLQTQLHFTLGQASFAASLFGIGALMGIPAGYLGDRFNQKWVIIISLICGIGVGYVLFDAAKTPLTQDLFSFLEGAFGSGFLFVNIYSLMQRCVPPNMIGRASGVYIASFYLPAALAGYLFALLVGSLGWGGAGIVQLVLMPVIGIVAMLFLDYSRVNHVRTKNSN
jgi:MFS family permease